MSMCNRSKIVVSTLEIVIEPLEMEKLFQHSFL